jgi:hypothetical protein
MRWKTDLSKLQTGRYYLWLLPTYENNKICCVWSVLYLDDMSHQSTPPRLATAHYRWINPVTRRKVVFVGEDIENCMVMGSLGEAQRTVEKLFKGGRTNAKKDKKD